MSSFNNPKSRKQRATDSTKEGEFKLVAAEQLLFTKIGSPRWRLTVIDPQTDAALVLTTAPGAESASSQRIGRGCIGGYFRISYRPTPSGKLVATSWRPCPATFKDWMADNLSLEDLNVLRESGASAGIQGLIHHAETLPLYERYRYSDLGDVVLSEQLLRSQSASDAADIAQLENALVWMVAERYAHDPTLAQDIVGRGVNA